MSLNIVIMAGLVITLLTAVPVMTQILRHHPKGLIILFFAEMWERFSYYGMRGILIFYLTQHFLFDDRRHLWLIHLARLSAAAGRRHSGGPLHRHPQGHRLRRRPAGRRSRTDGLRRPCRDRNPHLCRRRISGRR